MGRPGWVYVLTNPSMPGLVKVGMTRATPAERARELSRSTGVPHPFVVAAAAKVSDPAATERALHRALAPNRVNARREFFRIKPEAAARALRTASGNPGTRYAEVGKTMAVLVAIAAALSWCSSPAF